MIERGKVECIAVVAQVCDVSWNEAEAFVESYFYRGMELETFYDRFTSGQIKFDAIDVPSEVVQNLLS